MATRLKTVQYSFPVLASITNNSLTNLTQITVYLPETGTKTFRSVVARVSCDDIITGTGGSVSNRTTNLRLGAATYASVVNTNTFTHSGMNHSHFFTSDFTSHFNTNWTGTSMTCDVQVLVAQSTGTTQGMANICVTLDITYEYDDTSTTQIKTVMIPLNAPVAGLPVAKPGSPTDTIPALDTYLPEASKTYRNMHIVVQGNEHRAAATTDHTLTMQIDALTSLTSGNYEGALAADRWYRFVWDITALGMTTNATHGFYLWASVARAHHPQIWLSVTYEFDASTTTSAMQSLLLPMDFASPMGGATASDYQRATRELWVQEPATITLQRLALYVFWDQSGAISGLNARVGTGSFVAYTDVATNLTGGNGCMVRNDSAFTLSRGRNTLQADVYRTDTADLGQNLCSFWIVNYTSGIHSSGIGAHNKTVSWNLQTTSTIAAAKQVAVAATAPNIPESDYFINANGTRLEYNNSGTTAVAGATVQVERLAAEGGIEWESVYTDIGETDVEAGLRTCYSQARDLFLRWPGDPGPDRMDMEAARRWRVVLANNGTAFYTLDWLFTYHTITYAAADSLTGTFSGTVTIGLHRADGNTSQKGELVKTTSRSGNGAFSFTWYDNTESLYVTASDGTHVGRSQDSLAT